jgi:hypothetical protein
MASPLNAKKLENKMKEGMTAFVEEVFKPSLRDKVDKLMDKMYATMITPRRKAKNSKQFGAFSQYGVPVDTGKLRSSIKKIPTVVTKGHIIGRIIQDSSIAPYGASVEYGHGIVRDGRYIGWVPPQSFMRSTRELYKGQIKKLIQS